MLSPSQNDKTFNISVITCFRHQDIRAKTRSRMTTATTFSRQNENLELVVVLVLESKGL